MQFIPVMAFSYLFKEIFFPTKYPVETIWSLFSFSGSAELSIWYRENNRFERKVLGNFNITDAYLQTSDLSELKTPV